MFLLFYASLYFLMNLFDSDVVDELINDVHRMSEMSVLLPNILTS